QLYNTTGTSSLTNSTVRDNNPANGRGVEIENASGTLNFTLSGNTIDNTTYPSASGGQGVLFAAPNASTANMTIVATGNTFAKTFSYGFQASFSGSSIG